MTNMGRSAVQRRQAQAMPLRATLESDPARLSNAVTSRPNKSWGVARLTSDPFSEHKQGLLVPVIPEEETEASLRG